MPPILSLSFVLFLKQRTEMILNLMVVMFFLAFIVYYDLNIDPIHPFPKHVNQVHFIALLMLSGLISALQGYEIYSLFKRYNSEIEKINASQRLVFSVIGHDLKSSASVNLSMADLISKNLMAPSELLELGDELKKIIRYSFKI